MAQLHANSVMQHKERFKKEAEELLLTGFPSTILRLNALIATPKFKKRDFSDMHESLNVPNDVTIHRDSILDIGDANIPPLKRVRYDSSSQTKIAAAFLKTNRYLADLIEEVKPPIVKLMKDVKVMKMWIAYMIPKIEDGNNFGVGIQEDTLGFVTLVEDFATGFYNRVMNYFTSRAKIVKKVVKYPDVEDFKRAVREFDEKEYLSFCLMLTEIRNEYCALYDMFMKNLDKLKKPRSSQATESLY